MGCLVLVLPVGFCLLLLWAMSRSSKPRCPSCGSRHAETRSAQWNHSYSFKLRKRCHDCGYEWEELECD